MLAAATMADHNMKTALVAADIKSLATQLNAHIDVPFVPEAFEQQWIEWILAKAVGVVPAELVKFLIDATDGLTEEEVTYYEDLLTKAVNSIIDIPLLSEDMEERLIRPVVHQLVQYAITGNALQI
jgi:uncharacterized protein (UPF0210 family)